MKNSTTTLKMYPHAYRYILIGLILLMSLDLAAQKKKVSSTGYGTAVHRVSNAGQYIKDWLLVGPVMINDQREPDAQAQETFFREELLSTVAITPGKPLLPVKIKGKEFSWKPYTSKENTIDLEVVFDKKDFCAAFALAEITSEVPVNAFLGIGSDDAVKVWLNGKLIHQNWIARGLTPDDDVVPVSLVKGSNQLLIEVQDIAGGWSFTTRLLDKAALSERLVKASGQGQLDEINSLLKAGVDLEYKNASGLTALGAAQLYGRQEVEALLLRQGAKKGPLPAAETMIDGLYSSLQGKVGPAFVILVAKDGKITYSKAYGYADVEQKVLATPTTKFRIGSITKQFTASAILKLQEAGKLKVTDKLSTYFPDFPRGGEVTLHHLLTHTSGIHSYTGKSDFLSKVTSPVTNEELLNYFKNDPYDFNPGDNWQYNNSGYFLLGYIIEKVSGKSYGAYLKETFFDPLGMTNTGVHTSTLKLTEEAKGYNKNVTGYERSLNWDMSWAGGAGALYSTVGDLYRWNEGLFGGKVLQAQSLQAAFTPVKLNNGQVPSDGKYGYGWGITDYRGEEVLQHSGGLHGFLSQLARFPEENLTVTMLTNLSPPEVNFNPITLGEFYVWDKMDKQASYTVAASSPQDLKGYEGRYDFKNGAVMIITAEGKDLFAQLTGQPKFQIFPAAVDEYFWKVVEAKIKFVKNEKGEVIHGHFVQGTFQIDAVRLPEEKIVTVDPTIYKNYVGKYDYGENIIITVTTENGKIFVQGTNQPIFEIFPLSEKEFVLKNLNARITFVSDTNGKTNKLLLDMGGQKKDVPKVE